MQDSCNIEQVAWDKYESQLRQIRTQVFMLEQHISADLEWDGLDETAVHLLALTSAGEAIGCARLLPEGSIGRMAVLKSWRRKGVGSMLLAESIKSHRQRGVNLMMLSAQVHAISFYAKAGFKVCSLPYLDANIKHVDMQLL